MKKKSNRQIVREHLYQTKHPPRREALVMIPVSDDGTIDGDIRAFEGDRQAIEDILESEVEKHIPPVFVAGWLAGKGLSGGKRRK